MRHRFRHFAAAIAAIVCCAVGMVSSNAIADEPVEKEDIWQSIYMGGVRVGYAHTFVEPVQQQGKTLIRTAYLSSFSYKRLGQPLVMKQILNTEETVDGEMLGFYFEIANPPNASTWTMGTVDGDQLKLKQTVDGQVKETTQEWKVGAKSPTFQERALRQSPLKPNEVRTFEAFLPEFNKVATIKLEAANLVDTPFMDGKSRRLLKVKMSQSVIPTMMITAFVDTKGEMLKVSTTLLSNEMVSYLVSRDEALKAISGAELDLAISTLVKVKPIPNAHATKSKKYRVTTRGQKIEGFLSASNTLSYKKIDDESAEVTVTSVPLPETAAIRSAPAEFLASSQYLQANDPRVKELADKAAAGATNPAEIARRMERYLFEKLGKKNLSTAMASAAEVVRTMGGDCTEHAVLLAALLRAKGIPSRVVVGFVYVEKLSAFGGHMWTEANLDGQWIPLDATIGRGGIGAAHIRMMDSSLSEDGLSAVSVLAPLVIAQLQIEVLD